MVQPFRHDDRAQATNVEQDGHNVLVAQAARVLSSKPEKSPSHWGGKLGDDEGPAIATPSATHGSEKPTKAHAAKALSSETEKSTLHSRGTLGDDKGPAIAALSATPRPENPNEAAELKFLSIEQLVQSGKSGIGKVQRDIVRLIDVMDVNASRALMEESDAFSHIDSKRYWAAKDKIKQSEDNLTDAKAASRNAQNSLELDAAISAYYFNPNDKGALRRLDPSGRIIHAIDDYSQAIQDPTYRQVQDIEVRTNASLNDPSTYRGKYAEMLLSRHPDGNSGLALGLIVQAKEYETLKRQDRFPAREN